MFADRLQRLGTENAFKVGDHIARVEATGQMVVKLNMGEPDFDAPIHVAAEAKTQIDNGNGHYCPPAGLESLRKAIARQVSETRGLDVDFRRVVVHPGGKPSIAYTMLAYVNAGDEVIYPSPGFPIYESWVTFVGAKTVPMRLRESDVFAMTADNLSKLITDKTKVIILNSPANPTGGLIEAEGLAEMAEVVREKAPADVRIYSDEIYENIIFDGLKHASIASFPGMEEKTLIASGHSKSFAMTGWRLGYVVLPTVEEAEVFKNFNINTISCTPPFVQEAGRVALESPESAAAIAKMVSAFDERRKFVVQTLNEIPGITCVMPKGAFYVFPNIAEACESIGAIEAFNKLSAEEQEKSSPSTILQMFALYKYGVATMDRPSFCRIGSEGEHYLRLSTAADMEQLREGLSRLEAAVNDVDGFADFVASGVPS